MSRRAISNPTVSIMRIIRLFISTISFVWDACMHENVHLWVVHQ